MFCGKESATPLLFHGILPYCYVIIRASGRLVYLFLTSLKFSFNPQTLARHQAQYSNIAHTFPKVAKLTIGAGNKCAFTRLPTVSGAMSALAFPHGHRQDISINFYIALTIGNAISTSFNLVPRLASKHTPHTPQNYRQAYFFTKTW